MRDKELQHLIESLIPDSKKTQEGIICGICHVPQKQLVSHLKKEHDKEVKERCNTKEYMVYEQEVRKHLRMLRKRLEREVRREKDPTLESDAQRQHKYREKQLLMDPEDFKRKHQDHQREYLKRRSEMNKDLVKEDNKRWKRQQKMKSKTREAAYKRFREETGYGPMFECVCCRTMCFRSQVVEYTEKVKRNILEKAAKACKGDQTIDEGFLKQMEGCSFKDSSRDPARNKDATDDSDNSEEEEQLIASYEHWFDRVDQIIDNLSDSRCLAQEMGLNELLQSLNDCEDFLWVFRDKVIDSMERMQENLLFMKDWTEEQKRFGKGHTGVLDKMKKHQDWMKKATKRVLNLLSEGKESGSTEEKEIAKIVQTFKAEKWKMAEISRCFYVSSQIILDLHLIFLNFRRPTTPPSRTSSSPAAAVVRRMPMNVTRTKTMM